MAKDITADSTVRGRAVIIRIVPDNPTDAQVLPQDLEKLPFLYRFW
jgi:hypothetical protein